MERYHNAAYLFGAIFFRFDVCKLAIMRLRSTRSCYVVQACTLIPTIVAFLAFIMSFSTCSYSSSHLFDWVCPYDATYARLLVTSGAANAFGMIGLVTVGVMQAIRSSLSTRHWALAAVILIFALFYTSLELVVAVARPQMSQEGFYVDEWPVLDVAGSTMLLISSILGIAFVMPSAKIKPVQRSSSRRRHSSSDAFDSHVETLNSGHAVFPLTSGFSPELDKKNHMPEITLCKTISASGNGSRNHSITTPGPLRAPQDAHIALHTRKYGRTARLPSQIPDLGGLLSPTDIARIEREREMSNVNL